MTLAGALLPWFLYKMLIRQLAASRSFEIGGEHLNAIRMEDAFYLIDLPTRSRGLGKLLGFLAYLVPAGLIVRHRSRVDFMVEDYYADEPRFLPVRQIDPASVLVEYFTPAVAADRAAKLAADRKVWRADAAVAKQAERAQQATSTAEEKARTQIRKAAADRAAAVLKTQR